MTRKHFKAIAAILLHEVETVENDSERLLVAAIGIQLANYFEEVNAQFDRIRFLRAAGLMGVKP